MTAAIENSSADFSVARHDMLNVLQALKLQYDLTMEAAEKCKSLEVSDHVECLSCLDRALSSARTMEKLVKRYTTLLNDMRDLACHKRDADSGSVQE
jgi:predicted nucleic acid-binding protein